VTDIKSSIYCGEVVHQRLRPRAHRLSYKVFTLLLDIDELEFLSLKYKFISYNGRTIYSINDKDHGYGGNIKEWVRNELAEAQLSKFSDKIMMLCYPRIFGYVFNPLTVFFCYSDTNILGAIIYEVHNTFKERHCYVLPVNNNDKKLIKQKCEKNFYVSPFIPDTCTYNFSVKAPEENVSVFIEDADKDGLLLTAGFSGKRGELNDRALLKTIIVYPLMTLKVIIGIHFEAIKLIMKRAPYFPHNRYLKKPACSKTSSKPLRQYRK
jgi:hypothetical protein